MAILRSLRHLGLSVSLLTVAGACERASGTDSPTPTPLVTAVATATIETPAPTPTATATSSPASSATPLATPEPTPDQSQPQDVGSWVLETTLPEFRVGDLVAARDLVIVVGCKPASEFGDCVRPKIEVSTGGDWAPADLDAAKGQIFLAAVAADADGFVAVGVERGPGQDSFGNETSTAASFTSEDGLTWHRAPDQKSLRGRKMNDVVARPGGGWIAVGSKAGPSVYAGFETWSSADGSSWKLIDSMPDVDVTGVTSYRGGHVAWGDGCVDACGPTPVFIWTSTDGREWDRTPDQPSLASANFGGVLGLSDGALAVGNHTRADESAEVAATWLSKDAARWPRQPLPDGENVVSFQLTTSATGFVAVGSQESGDHVLWRTWASSDGVSWKRLQGADLAAGILSKFPRPALSADDRNVILVGQSASSATSAAVFRLGSE